MPTLNWLKGTPKAPRRIPGDLRAPGREPGFGGAAAPVDPPLFDDLPQAAPEPKARPVAAPLRRPSAAGTTATPPRATAAARAAAKARAQGQGRGQDRGSAPSGEPVLTPRVAAKTPDKPARRRFARRSVRAGVLGGAVLVLGGLVLLGADWFAELPGRLNQEVAVTLAGAGLTVQNVTVIGRHDTPPDAVLEALRVRRGDPILSVDPEEARVALEQLGWVKQARVRRALPDTLHIELIERRPMAIWQHQGVTRVIDHDGKVIGENGERFRNELPLVVGEDAPAKAADLLRMLATQPALAARVTASIRVGGRRWNLTLDNGVEVRLPAEAPEAAFAELARLDQHYALLARDVVGIDLRLPDRLVVKLSSGAVETRAVAGKDT